MALVGLVSVIVGIVGWRATRGVRHEMVPGAPESESLSTAERAAIMEQGIRALEDAERTVSRERWDLDYVVERHGRSAEGIFEWVRNGTYWVPYRGVLRGARGVLMDRQGNSLDRALLLSALLTKAGHTTRLAHAVLDRDRARHLLPGIIARRPWLTDRGVRTADSDEEIRNALTGVTPDAARLAQSLLARSDKMVATIDLLRARARTQSSQLLDRLGERAVRFDWSERLDTATSLLSDHWWVQLQQGGAWVDMDLDTPPGSKARALVLPVETMAPEALDSVLFHQVTVRLVVERWDGAALRETTAFEHALRSSESLGGTLVLRILPSDWPAGLSRTTDLSATVRASALSQTSWRASLLSANDLLADVVIRETGEVENAAAGGPFGGLGQGIVGALGQPGTSGALTGVWLEYRIRIPSRADQTVRRALFDLIGPAGRSAQPKRPPVLDDTARLRRSLALFRSTEILCSGVP